MYTYVYTYVYIHICTHMGVGRAVIHTRMYIHMSTAYKFIDTCAGTHT